MKVGLGGLYKVSTRIYESFVALVLGGVLQGFYQGYFQAL